jgi:predicted transcriptional regulator
MYTCFTSHEDDLLHGLPVEAQLLYLRGLRRYMDYTTAIVGGAARRISLLMLCELLEVFPHQGMKATRPDKSKIRRLLGWLERTGLIERIEDRDGYLVYFLPHAKNHGWADAHSSDRNKADTKPTQTRHETKPISDAGLSVIPKTQKPRKSAKPDTHQTSNIKQIQTTTTTDELSVVYDKTVVCGGGCSSAPVVSNQLPQHEIPTSPPTDIVAEQVSQSASWEEKLIFPDGLRDRDKTAIFHHLQRCPAEQRQAVVDELAARLERVKTPSGYVRKLVDCVLSGEFIPEAGIQLAAARERHKNDFQSPLPTRRTAPSDSVRAEIERLTAEMVAAQRAGDFKRYSRLGARVGLLTCGYST